jgi:RNA-directed DNA polymerase
MKGKCFLARYCDDFVMGFKNKEDMESVMDVLPKRFGKFGLTLHPEKTRNFYFPRPRLEELKVPRKIKRETFDFLGFTFYWGRTNKEKWAVKAKTARDRFTRALTQINLWCMKQAPLH